jgi:predicted dienelactone hydrolase
MGSLTLNRKRNWKVAAILISLVALIAISRYFAASPGLGAEGPIPQRSFTIAGLNVIAWTPPKAVPGPWPVIIFSHGFHGCSTQSTFLTEGLAAAGYAVFAPDHHDAACHNPRALLGRPDEPFGQPYRWSDTTYADREHDIEKLIDALKHDPTYGGSQFDWNELGLIGHSLGGYTVLGLSGAWPSWKDPRVKAVVGLSPFSTPFLTRGQLGNLGIPVMYQGGTLDMGITPFVAKANGVYDQTRPPKYYIELDGAGHMAWTDLRATYHAAIVEYTVAFLDRYLKGKPFPQALNVPHDVVSAVRITG